MRLQEIYCICKNVHTSWIEPRFIERKTPGNITYFALVDSDSIRSCILGLEKIDSFKACLDQVKNTSFGFKQITGEITFDSRNKNLFLDKYNILHNKVITIVELYESFNKDVDLEGFDVKLPLEITLSDLSKCTKDLNTIFSTCPLISKENGVVQFSSVDVGSAWLTFVVTGAAVVGVLTMIAALVDKAIIIRSHYLTTEEQKERIRNLKLGNDALEGCEKLNKIIRDGLLKSATDELASEHDISDPEDVNRLSNSIDLLSKWMCVGLEVYASTKSAPEVKAVFPAVEVQSLTESTMKLLGEKTEESDE